MCKKIIVEKDKAYIKQFRLHKVGRPQDGTPAVTTTIPIDVIRKEARMKGLSVEQFIKKYKAEWSFNEFKGIHLDFVEKKEMKRKNE